MRAVIIEDELNVREALKKMLILIGSNIEILYETAYVSEAVEYLSNNIVDVVFMDIELEDGTGFDVLKQLKNIDFSIIFTTAYNQYAIKAFKYSAIDYLLKPIDPEELENAINRSAKSIEEKKEHLELLEVLKNNISKEKQKIVIKPTENRYILDIDNIIHLTADGAYTTFVSVNRTVIASKNIKHFQSILDRNFIRCHQSHLVNSNHIKSFNKNNELLMSNNDLVPISTRKKAEIIEIISNL